jgi:hypothetical protein
MIGTITPEKIRVRAGTLRPATSGSSVSRSTVISGVVSGNWWKFLSGDLRAR